MHADLASLRSAGIGEGVKIADLNGQLLFYSKDKRFGRDHETIFEAGGNPVGTLQKKMMSMVSAPSTVASGRTLLHNVRHD